MKINEVKGKAKALGITCGKMKKVEMIHAIQQREGYIPCFGTTNGQCANADCCFIGDCLKTKS